MSRATGFTWIECRCYRVIEGHNGLLNKTFNFMLPTLLNQTISHGRILHRIPPVWPAIVHLRAVYAAITQQKVLAEVGVL